jgi:hypothetical protein
MTREVEQLVEEMRRESSSWKPGAIITILDHPHPGTEPSRWAYCQHLTVIFVDRPDVTVSLVETPKADVAYRFMEGRLVRQRGRSGDRRPGTQETQ